MNIINTGEKIWAAAIIQLLDAGVVFAVDSCAPVHATERRDKFGSILV